MKKFLLRLFFFGCFSVLLGEIIGHYYNLPFKSPSAMIQNNSRIYRPNQSGVCSNCFPRIPWQVNDYGYLGVFYLDSRPLFSIIGDSYIENIMNPITSNQGYLLKKHFPQYGFIEAGVSGMAFFEAMVTAKALNEKYLPDYHLLYVSRDSDFYESISNLGARLHTFQIKIADEQITVNPVILELGEGTIGQLIRFVLTNSKTAFLLYSKSSMLQQKQAILQWICGGGYAKNGFETYFADASPCPS